MSGWSAENAKRAYLQALKMAKRGKEPDVAEFISALAAGKNARFMVVVCAGVAGSTTLALAAAAAAHQTSGRVVCISSGPDESQAIRKALGVYSNCVEFVVGDAKGLLLGEYRGSDFVLVDCEITNAREILLAGFEGVKKDCDAIVVGYNVKHKVSIWRKMKASFLPIGEGLLVIKMDQNLKSNDKVDKKKRSCNWIVEVDNCTGEEHIFRVSSPYRKVQPIQV